MTKVIAVAQHKGGTGKTTSTLNLGAALSKQGKHVLLVDLDPQANLSQSLGILEADKNIYGAFKKAYPISEAIVNTTEGLDLVPSTLDLTGAEIELSSVIGREYILKELLEGMNKSYDYIFIDCPPSLGLLTANAFTAARFIIIPLQAQYLALQGLNKLMEVVEIIKRGINKDLKVGGVFITQYDNRKVLNRNVHDTINELFKSQVFNTVIRDNIALAEAPVNGVDIFRYAPKSKGAEDYLALSEEVIHVCK
ncbi:ParA family protein [Paraflavisolibacter sp. H34]|uniref:ParA family protein n=1 Tax=Huijunlia imazamoxiresistens TaxID=3127457 RepID=UPI003019A099